MIRKVKSIRAFIGAKDYGISRKFYSELGFKESVIDSKMSLFWVNENLSFYLQDYYVKEWINNSMILLEVDDVVDCRDMLMSKNLHSRYDRVTLSEIKDTPHGREIFMHDPSGVLWHIFQFH